MENIKLSRERSAPERSPFQEGFNAHCFFTGAGRGDLLADLLAAASEPVTFITLTGEEGCGKTTMCQMVDSVLPDEFIPIFFPQALQSFEDLPRGIANVMQIDMAEPAAAGDIRELMLEVWERLKERNQRIMLIFDQAESINPAILDRIRKMMDILNNTGIAFQTLFAGGRGLRERLQTLSLCSFEGVTERHFLIAPLDSSETYSYLNFCIHGQGGEGVEAINPEISEKIFREANGNIRITNRLAEQSLKLPNKDTSFMVLLDNVEDRPPAGRARRRRSTSRQENFLASKKFLVPAGACFVLLLLILMIMQMGNRSDSRKSELPASQPQSSPVAKGDQAAPDGMNNEAAKMEKPLEGDEVPSPAEVESESHPVAEVPSQQSVLTPEKIDAADVKPEPAQSAAVPKSIPAVEEKKIVQNKEPVIAKAHPVSPTAPVKAAAPAAQKIPIKKKEAVVKRVPAEKLFTNRVAASAKWLVGVKKDRFTIQLLVLASSGAENSIKKMLVQQQYQDIGGHLYILRKPGVPPMVLMFYGEYQTMAEAKNAQKSLPPFLLKNRPYPVSVKTAVMKATGT